MKILEKWFENLKEIREELIDTVKTITEEEFTWEPKPGMKSAKALLIEIAVGELWLNHFLTNPDKPLLWKEAFTLVKGDTLASLLAELDSIRKNTLKLYSEYPEADLFLEMLGMGWLLKVKQTQTLKLQTAQSKAQGKMA